MSKRCFTAFICSCVSRGLLVTEEVPAAEVFLHVLTVSLTLTQGERFDQQKGPAIEELVALEDVDKLGYMGWQIDQAADPQKVKCTHMLVSFQASIPSWVQLVPVQWYYMKLWRLHVITVWLHILSPRYCSAEYTVVSQKSALGQSTLQVSQRGVWMLFRLFPYLTTKEHPHNVHSDSKPSKQIMGHEITYSGITSVFKVKS